MGSMGPWVESNIGGILHHQSNPSSVSLPLLQPWLRKQLVLQVRDQETKNEETLNCGFPADKVLLFCPGSLTSCRDVLPAEPAAVPVPPASAPHPSAPQRAQHSVCLQPSLQAALPALRAAAAWATTGTAGPATAGTRAPTPAMVTGVCSPGALAVTRALGATAHLGP